MKLVALVILIHPLLILGFSALGVATQAGTSGITNPGYHGLSQVLYEFASSAANNGSGLRDWPTTVYSGISRPGWQCSLEDIFPL